MTNVFTSNNFRAAAATAPAFVAAASFVVAEASTKVAKKVAGKEAWEKTPFHGMIDAHTKGFVFSVPDSKELLKKAVESKEEADHSDMVEWKKGKWVPSAKATELAKKAGYKEAFVPQMYKAANWLIRIAKQGADKTYEGRCFAFWAYRALLGHAKYMAEKGVKNAQSVEAIKGYFEKACKHSKVATDKLIKWDELLAMVKADAEAVAAEAEETTEERITVEEGKEILAEVEAEEQPVELGSEEKAEARDGRAPKTAPAAKYDIKALVRKAGVSRLKADNAYEVAEKAKAAFEASKLTNDEFRFVVDACIAKDGGDPEEFYALMGEN